MYFIVVARSFGASPPTGRAPRTGVESRRPITCLFKLFSKSIINSITVAELSVRAYEVCV